MRLSAFGVYRCGDVVLGRLARREADDTPTVSNRTWSCRTGHGFCAVLALSGRRDSCALFVFTFERRFPVSEEAPQLAAAAP